MKHEFEQIAGYEVTMEDYNKIIEPMYMATNLSKEEFVKVIDKKRFALKPLKTIIKEMKKCAKSLKETCTHYTDYETKDRMTELAREYRDRVYGNSEVAVYMFNEEMLWSCYYPINVDFFDPKTGKSYERISF